MSEQTPSQKVPTHKNALQEAYEAARQNPGKMIILGSSAKEGNVIIVSDKPAYETTERKALFGSEGFSFDL